MERNAVRARDDIRVIPEEGTETAPGDTHVDFRFLVRTGG